jgi:hypothetical protein
MAVRPVVRLVVAASLTTAALASSAAPSAAEPHVEHRPPVDAPVSDPFRPPVSDFGPGNRGLTYDLPPGTAVRASAAGEVVFAGLVAGSLHVTVLHADGLRSSYSFLESVAVRRGQDVDAGGVVGSAGQGFHFGVREGSAYLDPAALFGGTEVHARLLPHEEPLPPTDAGLLRERIALRGVVEERSAMERFLGRAAEIASGAFDDLRAGLHVYSQLSPTGPIVEAAETLWDRRGEDCTPSEKIPRTDASGRVALLVAGHGSDSRRAGIDGLRTDHLGYRPSDVLRYSYAGGRTPDPEGVLDAALVGIPARPYGFADTTGDLEVQGRQLADLVEEVAEARPGAAIDLYAHSQGGVVARLALLELSHRPGGLDALGAVITIGTPHDGADLATIAAQLGPGDRSSVELVAGLAGSGITLPSRAVDQLAETSGVVERLRREGVPDGVELRTIGARGDLVVTADKTAVDGHPSAVVGLSGPRAHHDLPAAEATTREISLALAGLPPSCDGLLDQVLDALVPEALSFGENAVGAGVLAA